MAEGNRLLAHFGLMAYVAATLCDSVCIDCGTAESAADYMEGRQATTVPPAQRAHLFHTMDSLHVELVKRKILDQFGVRDETFVLRRRQRRELAGAAGDEGNAAAATRVAPMMLAGDTDRPLHVWYSTLRVNEATGHHLRHHHRRNGCHYAFNVSSALRRVQSAELWLDASGTDAWHHSVLHVHNGAADARHRVKLLAPAYNRRQGDSLIYDLGTEGMRMSGIVHVRIHRSIGDEGGAAATCPTLALKFDVPQHAAGAPLLSRPARQAARSPTDQYIIGDCERQFGEALMNDTSSSFQANVLPCCRRRVRIDFGAIGWGEWIVSPRIVDSYYCIGRCNSFGGVARTERAGSAIYADVRNHQNTVLSMGLRPCCSPVMFSPLTVTVLSGDAEVVTQTIGDVIVAQCGCL